jgi:hypothetical protein
MNAVDRRKVLTGVICGGAVVTLGLSAVPKAAQSTPLGLVKSGAVKTESLVEEARATVHVHPRRGTITVTIGAARGIGDVACAAGADSVTNRMHPAF